MLRKYCETVKAKKIDSRQEYFIELECACSVNLKLERTLNVGVIEQFSFLPSFLHRATTIRYWKEKLKKAFHYRSTTVAVIVYLVDMSSDNVEQIELRRSGIRWRGALS